VQLYASDTATGVTLPQQQLIGFSRVDLAPGQSKTVAFRVPMSVLAYTGLSGDLVMEPGAVELSVGSSSSDIRSQSSVNVTGRAQVIAPEARSFFSAVSVS
jgi:beta-glucosidase